MGRQHMASILPTSSVRIEFTDSLANLMREAIELSVRGHKKMLRLILTVTFVIIVTCFLYTTLNIPQTNDNPDATCSASSYQTLGRYNSITGCKECPDCPPGQQPTPPCGSRVQPDASISCTVCPSETFKARSGRGICKPCLTCGQRETVSSCTASKNAQCGNCPRGTFRLGFTVDSCQQCSSCCATKRFAEVECYYLRQCLRTNCSQEIENEGYNIENLEVNSHRLTTPKKMTLPNPVPLQGVSSSTSSDEFMPKNLTSKNVSKRTRVERNVPQAPKRASVGNTSKLANERGNPLLSNNLHYTITTTTNTLEGFATVSTHIHTVESNLEMDLSPFGINFTELVRILIVLVAILILAFILVCGVMAYFCSKWQSEHLQPRYCVFNCCIYLNSTEGYKQLLDETTHKSGDAKQASLINGNLECSFPEKSTATAGFENTFLDDISPFLEDILVKKLEVENSWKKVGSALKINQDDLDYWENGKSMASPAAGELLKTLKVTYPELTIADLISILERPDIQRQDVVQRIQQYLQSERS